MKNREQINIKIKELNVELIAKKAEYRVLGQIDMLSSTGNKLNERIWLLQGKLNSLYWALGSIKTTGL